MTPRARTARRGLFLATGLLAAMLVGVSGWGWWQLHTARHALAAAQAEQIVMALVPCLASESLDTCAAREPALRHVEVDGFMPYGEDPFPDVRPEPGALLMELPDGTIRARAPMPPNRPGGGPEERPPRGAPPPQLQFDFQPLFAAQVEAQARTAFALSSIAAIGLLVAAGLLQRALARAERAEAESARNRELAAMGEMSAVLAHEIRNPVAALLGNAQLLAEEVDNAEVRHMVDSARRLRTLTEDLLAFARTGEVRRVLTDPVAPARTALGDRGTLFVHHAPPWPLDAARVEQLLGDLIDNAPGPVELTVAVDHDLVYTVRDHGEGLPPGDPERLFAPFFTTRARGTGLGLAVVRRLVEAHGGTVTAANHPEGGALFTVRIPKGKT